MKKKLFIFVIIFIALYFNFSERLNFKNKEPNGLKFKPIYLVRITYYEKYDLYKDYFLFLIGETKDLKILAIDLTFKSKINSIFDKPIYNNIYVNFKKIIDRNKIPTSMLSTWHAITLKDSIINDENFIFIENKKSNLIYDYLKKKYYVNCILDIQNRAEYIFTTYDPISTESIKYIKEEVVKNK
jgi:hypothetical protein